MTLRVSYVSARTTIDNVYTHLRSRIHSAVYVIILIFHNDKRVSFTLVRVLHEESAYCIWLAIVQITISSILTENDLGIPDE